MAQPIKRQFRNDMSDAQKQAISQKLRGRTLSQATKQKISQSMTDYWNALPTKPTNDNPYGNNDDKNATT